MPKTLTPEQIDGWETLIDKAVEDQRSRPPEMAHEMRKAIEDIEARAEADGIVLPKHSHRFAPDNLWPDDKQR